MKLVLSVSCKARSLSNSPMKLALSLPAAPRFADRRETTMQTSRTTNISLKLYSSMPNSSNIFLVSTYDPLSSLQFRQLICLLYKLAIILKLSLNYFMQYGNKLMKHVRWMIDCTWDQCSMLRVMWPLTYWHRSEKKLRRIAFL